MNKLQGKLKNIAIVLIGIVIILIGIDKASQALASKMTENLNYGYIVDLKK